MAERGGFLSDDAFVRDVVLGITLRTVEDLRCVPNSVSWRERRHSWTDGFDNAGNVMTGNGWKWYIVAIVAAPNLVIQGANRRGMNAHKDLSQLPAGRACARQKARTTPGHQKNLVSTPSLLLLRCSPYRGCSMSIDQRVWPQAGLGNVIGPRICTSSAHCRPDNGQRRLLRSQPAPVGLLR